MWRTREVVLGAACLTVGSVGQLVQAVVTPVSSAGKVVDNVAAATASPTATQAGAWLDLCALFFVPALVIVGGLAGARTTRLGWIATVLTVGSTLPGIAYLLATDVLYVGAAQGKVPAAAIDAYLAEPVVTVSTALFLLGHVLGILLLGIALWRAGRVPQWAAACLAVFPFLEIGGTAADLTIVTVAAYVLLVSAFGACAAVLLRERSGAVTARTEQVPVAY
jgi:hypothetical protein